MSHNQVEVLLVEDSMDDAGLVIRAFKKSHLGNNIVHLTDGAEALDFLFARGKYSNREEMSLPKIILLDIKMPKVDGLQVLKEIKSNESTKSIPVIMMTSSNQDKDIEESYKLGANSYVVKPVGFENFSKAVVDVGMYWFLLNEPVIK